MHKYRVSKTLRLLLILTLCSGLGGAGYEAFQHLTLSMGMEDEIDDGNDNVDNMRFYLQQGGSPDTRMFASGRTALQEARLRGRTQQMRLLQQAGEKK